MEKKKSHVKKKTNTRNKMTEKPMNNTTDQNNTIRADSREEMEPKVEPPEMPSGNGAHEEDESPAKHNDASEVSGDLKPREEPIAPAVGAATVVRSDSPLKDQISAQTKQETGQGVFSSASATIQMLNHPNENLRIEAIESLLRIADKSMGYAFASAMKDESHRVRLGALRGLYKFGGDLATEYLLKALEDINPDVRRRALIYLGWMRKKEFVPYITSALADASSRVRRVATYALSDIKDASAVPYLIKALDDSDREVVNGAVAALKRITSQSFTSEHKSLDAAQKEIVAQYKEWWEQENQ